MTRENVFHVVVDSPSELPKIEMLALAGKAVEGDVLTAVEVIPKSEIQQHVWGKYKKDVKYQWYVVVLKA